MSDHGPHILRRLSRMRLGGGRGSLVSPSTPPSRRRYVPEPHPPPGHRVLTGDDAVVGPADRV